MGNLAKAKNRIPSEDGTIVSIVKRCVPSIGIAIAVEVVLFCLVAAIFVNVDASYFLYNQIAVILTVISTAAASYLMGRKNKNFGLVSGFTLGIVIFLIILLASVVFADNEMSARALIVLAILVLSGGLFGFIGVSSQGKSKVKHRI